MHFCVRAAGLQTGGNVIPGTCFDLHSKALRFCNKIRRDTGPSKFNSQDLISQWSACSGHLHVADNRYPPIIETVYVFTVSTGQELLRTHFHCVPPLWK